jgi:hypothetical protein
MLEMITLKTPRQSCCLFYVFCLILLTLLIISCGGGGSSAPQISLPVSNSAKDITAFSILGRNGNIAGNAISITLPHGASRTALVAMFTTTGASVRVGSIPQSSGVTANDFTNPVEYVVTAQNSSTKTYAVTVTLTPAPTGQITADHIAAANFNIIPQAQILAAKANLHIAYGHTSHGSQLITGMDALAAANSLYSWNHGGTGGALDLEDYAMGGDVGYYPDWVTNTRTYLGTPNLSGRGTTNPDVNVIIWSWCGQASSKTQQTMIDEYLVPMAQLEVDYFGIKFVYMTGHLDGSGEGGDLNVRNEQIRAYCVANNKILFDFADIESYDPDGWTNFMLLNANDGCNYSDGNWATEWITANPLHILTTLANSCGACAHSEKLNCAVKGRAAWWLWARIAGWDGNP